MDISDLTGYAREKFGIEEDHKWAAFPGFSVLIDPETKKWAALVMRQWDRDLGEEVCRCDIKCGQDILTGSAFPWLSMPFRMHGDSWVGVRMTDETDPDVVYSLFDRAIERLRKGTGGAKIVVGTSLLTRAHHLAPGRDTKAERTYHSTPIPFPDPGKKLPAPTTRVPAPLPAEGIRGPVPEKILEMEKLYLFKDGSFQEKCENFLRQGKYMADYVDDLPWTGSLYRYFPTYHDFNIPQLRGYFTWRTGVRKGVYEKTVETFVYLYLYEILNGIGAGDLEDKLSKIDRLKASYVDKGYGDKSIERDIKRWRYDLCIVNAARPSLIEKYMEEGTLSEDKALAALSDPKETDDAEIIPALTFFYPKLQTSIVLTKGKEEGARLLARVWKEVDASSGLFSDIFGERKRNRWFPFSNAIYCLSDGLPKGAVMADPVRSYIHDEYGWEEDRYQKLTFKRDRLNSFLHETDRLLRIYLKLGRPLKEKKEDAWARPLIEKILNEDRREKIEAERPKVSIHLASLDKIREDAAETRDSLLTEEEVDDSLDLLEKEAGKVREEAIDKVPEEKHEVKREEGRDDEEAADGISLPPLEGDVLSLLLKGEDPKGLIQERHGMAEVIADSINAAFLDEVGDSVVECVDGELALIPDYIDDLKGLFHQG